MSTVVRLALRNLWRSPRRSALTLIAVVAGVAITIIGRGFLQGSVESVIVGAVDGTVGHVTARPPDYPTRPLQHPVDELLEVNAATERLLTANARAWTGRTLFTPLVSKGGGALRVSGIGFDPARDETVFPRTRWHVDGTMPRGGEREVGVSPQVARLLDLSPGDVVVLKVRGHDGAMNALEATVSGVVRTGNLALDARGLWAPIALTRELVGSAAPSHLSVKLADRDDAAAFAARLGKVLGEGAEVVTWQEETSELVALQETRTKALDMVVFVLLALAAFGIANTILMAAHERVREIGTLRSLGMTEGGVVRLFLLEGALIGLVGGALGVALGGGLVAYWSRHPIDLTKVMEAQGASYAISPLIYTRVEPPLLVAALLLGVVVATLASLYPARVASRMVPADAVRANA